MTKTLPVEMIAHRGSSYTAPENTLAAFRLGWQETTTCELDVRATRDGKLVVIHDDSTQRTAGIDLKVADALLSELQEVDVGAFKGEQWRGEKVPSLEEVVAAMPEGKKLLIEIKVGPEIMPKMARVIHASGKETQLLLQSFSSATCAEAKRMFPDIPIYLLVACRHDAANGVWSPTLEQIVEMVQKNGLNGVGINNTPLIDVAAVRAIRVAGLKLNVWTVDQLDEARRLVERGVDGIITNRPGWLRSQLS